MYPLGKDNEEFLNHLKACEWAWNFELEELGFDLTPLAACEPYAAYCNSNYWLVSYDAKGMRVHNTDEHGLESHLSEQQSLTDPRVVKRYWWCPHCMKSIDYPNPRHIATHWDSHDFTVVMTRKK